ncbi:MAG: phage tail protein [Lewinellaceae bacterium]|nr:phage tail protein [Lewinellaceae bacterium]
MPVLKEDIKRAYPLPTYNYRVRIGGEPHAFSEVSGLSMDYEAITYKHGLSWREGSTQMPGMPGEVKLTLKRGIVRNRSVLLEWIKTIRLNNVKKREVVIDLCDEMGIPVISWKVHNAFPVKLDVPSFDSTSNEVAVESLELMANRLEIIYND